jgi:hypothetical protein
MAEAADTEADMAEAATRHSAEVEATGEDMVADIMEDMAADMVAHDPMLHTAEAIADTAEVTADTAARGTMADMAEDTGDITVATAIITGDPITESDSIHTVTQGTRFPAIGPKYATPGGAVRSGYPAVTDISVRATKKALLHDRASPLAGSPGFTSQTEWLLISETERRRSVLDASE